MNEGLTLPEFRAALLKERSRFLRWGLCCAVFAPAVATLAVKAKSVALAIVAAYFVFFAWDPLDALEACDSLDIHSQR
jgi:hypothetical protein